MPAVKAVNCCAFKKLISAAFILCRPPPPPPAATATADVAAAVAGNAGSSVEMPAEVEQPPASTGGLSIAITGPPVIDVQTNPELPSPARVRWMDAFSRVCAHLNQVRAA